MAKAKFIPGNYVYDRMKDLIDYVSETDSHWSPNNIRRLILAPDVFLLQKHINSATAGKYDMGKDFGLMGQSGAHVECMNSVYLDPSKLNYWLETDPSKRKGIQVAISEHIPQLLEEIVICRTGNYTSVNSHIDQNVIIQGLLKGYTDKSLEGLKKRYSRLASFIIFDGTPQQFIAGLNPESFDKYHLLCDDLFVKAHAHIELLNKDTWYNAVSGNAKDYTFDIKGGSLSNRMYLVRKTLQEQEDSKLDVDLVNDYIDWLSYTFFVKKIFKDMIIKIKENKPNLYMNTFMNKSMKTVFGLTIPVLNSQDYINSALRNLQLSGLDALDYDKLLTLDRLAFNKDERRKGDALIKKGIKKLVDFNIETIESFIRIVKSLYNVLYTGSSRALPKFEPLYTEVGGILKELDKVKSLQAEDVGLMNESIDCINKAMELLVDYGF